MAFSIRFLPESFQEIEHDPIMEAIGEIVLGEFSELFLASLSFWTKAQYEAHWREALNRIVQNVSPSGLITTMYDPVVANFIFWWPMYRQGSDVIVHNQMLLLMEIEERLDPNNPYSLIPEYYRVSEDGEKVSEWRISIGDVCTFLQQTW
jgi:hypothetical protein